MKEKKLKNIILNSMFWTVSFIVLFRFFTKEYYNGSVDFIYTGVFHIPLFIVVFIHSIIIHRYLNSKKYIIYLLGFVCLSVFGVVLHHFVFDQLSPFLLSDYYFISMPFVEVIQYIVAYLLISLLFALSKNWFQLRANQFALEAENNRTQLNNLKAQLNPHFLFNSINNIYSITHKENKEARNYIIKLSDALRYMLYKTSSDVVKLSDEIEYLDNYIELEKLRLESNANINFLKNDAVENLTIAPLILLPFIENCFKHCEKLNAKINIELSISGNDLILICENNKSIVPVNRGGIGLENAQKRLELLYPEKHTLDIQDLPLIYKSTLTLEL